MGKGLLHLLTTACVLFSCLLPGSSNAQTDSVQTNNGLVIEADTLIQDSLRSDTSLGLANQSLIDYTVERSAQDSTITDVQNKLIHLYGQAKVIYGEVELEADYIRFDLSTNEVFATGMPDSLGEIQGKPKFTEGGKTYNAHEITYNFESSKGKIKQVITQEGDGYIHGNRVKKVNDTVFYIAHGKYTTCELEHPHFFIGANKLKIITGQKIVTGPAYLVLQDVYTPLVIPFGFFPTEDERASGVLFPSYGYSTGRGYFLRNGGYYLAINDHLDLALRGDIYSRGSWALNAQSNYKVRYKYNGSLNLGRSIQKDGDPEFPNYAESKDFFVRWQHRQDPKARPNSNFSANVNLGSSTYLQNNSLNPNDVLTNTLQSNVSYNYAIPNSPFNVSLNLKHSQNTKTRDINLSLPELAFTMSRQFPFKRKVQVGQQKWYEKIGVSYSMNAQNRISSKDTLLFDETIPLERKLDDLKNGVKHNLPISTNLKVLNHFNLTPSANYTELWYFKSIRKEWNPNSALVEQDTVRGFESARYFNLSAGLSTRLYGMVGFKKGKIKALRHVLTPNVSFTYRPDFSKQNWGYYQNYQTDSLGNTSQYSIFEGGIYGGPPSGESGSINFSLNNNLEMKVRTQNDSTGLGEKKIKLLESFTVSSGYNLAADDFNWSNIGFNGRSRLSKQVDFKFTGTLDPYQLDSNGSRINQLYFDQTQRIGRLTNASFSLTFNFRQGGDQKKSSEKGSEAELDMINNNPEAYVDFNVPWSLRAFYTVRYSKPGLESNITQSLTFSGDLKLTPKWKIGFNSGYDFVNGDLTYTSIDIFRDLHCWEMSFNWIPFGFRQSYMLTIRVKAPVLQDLKLNRRQGWFDR